MVQLNLPPFEYRLSQVNGKTAIFDILRRKYIILTPEEWVRQHFIHHLINDLQYPKALIKLESGLKYNQLGGRSDILVYDRNGFPFLLVECKADYIAINDKVFHQAARYNATIKAPYLVVTNGMQHFCFKIDHAGKGFAQMQQIPTLSAS